MFFQPSCHRRHCSVIYETATCIFTTFSKRFPSKYRGSIILSIKGKFYDCRKVAFKTTFEHSQRPSLDILRRGLDLEILLKKFLWPPHVTMLEKIWKGILLEKKHSTFKTADMVWLSLYIRITICCNIPSPLLTEFYLQTTLAENNSSSRRINSKNLFLL